MNAEARASQYFDELTRDAQRAAIQRLSAEGFSEHTIAAATKLNIEFVRAILTERRTHA